MKEKDFDFGRVGKRLPYRMDEESLEKVTRRVFEICDREEHSRKAELRKSHSRKHYLYYVAGAVAAVLFLFIYIGVDHKESVSTRFDTASISVADSDNSDLLFSDRYVENVFDEVSQKDSGTDISSFENTGINTDDVNFIYADRNMPTDQLIDELSDEDLFFLAEITGGTVAEPWYN